jgi:hypothetical protein
MGVQGDRDEFVEIDPRGVPEEMYPWVSAVRGPEAHIEGSLFVSQAALTWWSSAPGPTFTANPKVELGIMYRSSDQPQFDRSFAT